MPDLLEHIYCAQQINIPPNLPYILKQYAKAAIRTQPYDLLYWSAAYFRAKANNSPPPVKERMEYPPFDSPSRLSPGFLRVLHKQLGKHEYVRIEVLYEKWLGVCLVKDALDSMLKIGNMNHRVPWLKFVAIASGHICDCLSKTMVLVCEILTDQPDGGAAWIPVEKFVELYKFLASLNCGPNPPVIKHVEIDVETPSVTSTILSAAPPEGKEETQIEEKDSTAGLMVWPDIEPQAKPERLRSPNVDDEPGATSMHGLEVFDDAKGTTTELVTLYPAPTKTEARGVTITSQAPTIIGRQPHQTVGEGESILSHSSLKENEDWINVQAKNLDELESNGEQSLDLDKLVEQTSATGKTATTTTIDKSANKEDEMSGKIGAEEPVDNEENQGDNTEEQNKDEQSNVEDEISRMESQNAEDKISRIGSQNRDKTPEKGTVSHSSSAAESKDNVFTVVEKTASQPQGRSKDIEDSLEKKTTFESTDSGFALNHTITMTNFDRQREVGYSVVEIRKGRVGEKSLDQISCNGPMSVPTEHRLSLDTEESVDSIDKEHHSYWEHVPGIGPVVPETQVLAVVEYMQHWATKQGGMVGPRNINHLLCPPLDLPPPALDELSMY